MEPRISPNLEAQVDVFGGISRREQGKPILAKEVMSYEMTATSPCFRKVDQETFKPY
jgi:repressor of nif and glnA expression